ncbi:MAG: hypothetical protein R3B13_01635 [Polyangiaceae bacterium]
MRNLTVSLDERVARWVRIAAAEQDTSVSKFVSRVLEARMHEDEVYAQAMARDLARDARPLKAARARYPKREDLHE